MHGTKEDAQKGSSSWQDVCNTNGDCSIPPTGLEFHNTRLLPSPGREQPTPISPHMPQSPREQEAVIKPRQKEMINCNKNNPVGSIGGLPQYTSSVIGSHKRPSYSGNVSNSSTHYYSGPHYSQLATAASSNYNTNTRYSYYQQHHT